MKLLFLLAAIAAAQYVSGTLPVLPGNFTATIRGVGLTPFPAGTLKVNRGALAYNTSSTPVALIGLPGYTVYVRGSGPYDGPNATTGVWTVGENGRCSKQGYPNPAATAQIYMTFLSFGWLHQGVQIGTMNATADSIWNPTSGPANCTLFRSSPLPYQGPGGDSTIGSGFAVTASFCASHNQLVGTVVQNSFGLGWLQGYVAEFAITNTPDVPIVMPASCDDAPQDLHDPALLVEKRRVHVV